MNGRVAAMAGLAVLMSGCVVRREVVVSPGGPPPHAPAYGYRRTFAYVYYPDVEVYYAADRAMWFWMADGEWRFGVELPRHYQVRLGNPVSINLECERPYEQHAMVIVKYPAHRGEGHAWGREEHGEGHGRGRGHAGVDRD